MGSTAISLIGQFKVDYAIIGASAIDEEGALLDFDYREVQAAQAEIMADAQRHAGRGGACRSRAGRASPISARSSQKTAPTSPAGLANICNHRGIEVVEAMDKPASDIDEQRRAVIDGGAAEERGLIVAGSSFLRDAADRCRHSRDPVAAPQDEVIHFRRGRNVRPSW